MQEKRISRLFSLLAYLSPHSQVTVHDLATDYQVNERTIQRDVKILRDAKLGVFQDEDDTIKISRSGYQKIKSWIAG